MAVQLSFPRANQPVKTSHGAFAVFGRSDAEVKSVSGTCQLVNSSSAPVAGTQIFPPSGPPQPHTQFIHHPGGDGHPRWLIAFRVPVAGQYNLRVTVDTVQGADSVSLSNVQVDMTPPAHNSATISWPGSDEDISAYESDFCPYGELTPNALGSVSLVDSNNNAVALLSAYGDPTDLQFWTAQFDTVPPGTYTLSVSDTSQTQASQSTGLTAS